MVGFCHLTDSHHYHHGQKPTMVGICHGGNMPVGHDDHLVVIDVVQEVKVEDLATGEHTMTKAFRMVLIMVVLQFLVRVVDLFPHVEEEGAIGILIFLFWL